MTASNSTHCDGENVTEVQADDLQGTVVLETFLEPSEADVTVEGEGGGSVFVTVQNSGVSFRLLLTESEATSLADELDDAAG